MRILVLLQKRPTDNVRQVHDDSWNHRELLHILYNGVLLHQTETLLGQLPVDGQNRQNFPETKHEVFIRLPQRGMPATHIHLFPNHAYSMCLAIFSRIQQHHSHVFVRTFVLRRVRSAQWTNPDLFHNYVPDGSQNEQVDAHY